MEAADKTWTQPPAEFVQKIRNFDVDDQKALKEGQELRQRLMQLQKDVTILVQEKKELEKMKSQMDKVSKDQHQQIESRDKTIEINKKALL